MTLRELRLKKGYTQQELAKKLNVSQQTIAKWEGGKGYPRVNALFKLSKIFGVKIDDFLRSK